MESNVNLSTTSQSSLCPPRRLSMAVVVTVAAACMAWGAMGEAHAKKARWAGPFFVIAPGYAFDGGSQGTKLPNAAGSGKTIELDQLPAADYDRAVRNDKGGGLGVWLQFGYNIMGYASLFADLAWHGSFGDKIDTAGVGAGSFMLGLHPLRFWRDDLDYDLRLYGGYGVYEINYYNEDGTQPEVKGKSWTGTNFAMGASFEYRLPESAIAFGLDARQVMGRYDTWVYNFDDDITATADPAAEKDRLELHLLISFHL